MVVRISGWSAVLASNAGSPLPFAPVEVLSGNLVVMPCTAPLHAYPPPPAAEGGKAAVVGGEAVASRKFVFSAHRSYAGARAITIPCGQCAGCRLDRARDWATRAYHEAQCHDRSSFLTLTYDDAHLPRDLSVSVREMQLFKKRLREAIGPFRDLTCGEYGDRTLRPHFHMACFGIWPDDARAWCASKSGETLYRSERLEKVWGRGIVYIGALTYESAGYIARYTMKKAKGDKDPERYRREAFDPITGELRSWYVAPEFLTMSRNPGLGAEWFERWKGDVFPSDFLVIEGRKVPVPRFYTDRLAREAEREALRIKARRKLNGFRHAENNTERRLMTRHESQELRARRLVRSLDAEG